MTTFSMTNQFEREKNAKAGGYTLMITSALFILMLLVNWQLPQFPEPLLNEGIEVNLGNSETGMGDVPPAVPGEPAPEAAQTVANAPQNNPPPQEQVAAEEEEPAKEDLPIIPKKTEKLVRPKQDAKNTAAAPKPKPQPPAPPKPKAKATMGAYTGGNGKGGNNQDGFNNVKNQGIAGGEGDQGKPNGNVNSDNYSGNGGTGSSGVAISKGLQGRRITRLPSFEDEFNENAKIAVDIRVNENGAVISATYQSKGSTSGSANLKAIAIRKALQLKFNDGDAESLGTIIFNFRLKG